MTQEGQVTPPPVMWAQRNNLLYITVCLEDCIDPTIKIVPEKLYFKGIGGTDRKMHEVTINFYKEIDPVKTVQSPKGRNFEFLLAKKEEGPYWPRLTKESKKFHWLKNDFNKWKDEFDTDEEDGNENFDIEEMMRSMGSLGDNDSKPNFDDPDSIEEPEADSDDEDMPDLE